MENAIQNDSNIAELKELIGYYRDITETVREPFVILDKGLRVITANAAFYQKFKVSKNTTEGKLIYKLGSNQWDSPDLRKLLEDILPKHNTLNNYTVTHDFPHIGRKTMVLNARRVDDKQLILLAIGDVSKYHKLMKDTEDITTSLIKQRDKLQNLSDAKDEFVSLASHQLRTPATIVRQYLGMLTQGYAGKLTETQMGMLEVAYKNNTRQLEIIEDLLRVARVDAGKVYLERKLCDMAGLIKTVIKEQTLLYRSRQQHIIFKNPKKKVYAYVDPKLISMVLENLLDNAGKYSPNGEQVIIRLRQTSTDTIISVQDKGVGIHSSDNKKLFKKFSRVDNSFSISVPGTGLGLYWTKKVLDLHGGAIDVISSKGIGSTFTICLPIITPDTGARAISIPVTIV